MEAVTPPLITGALAAALEAGRERYNARIAAARRTVPAFDAARFARHFAATARPAVDAVAVVAPERVQPVADTLFEIAIELAGRGALGPAAAAAVDAAWTEALPPVARLLAHAPDLMIRALTNAVCNLALVAGGRPIEWTGRMTAGGAACTTADEWLASGLVAAWTSGAAHFRTRALAALAALPPAAARAVLGLPPTDSPADPPTLAARLEADPWLPPSRVETAAAGRSLEIVQTAGGFRGLGGSFMAPPDVALSQGRVVVVDGQTAWGLFADACGATLVRIDTPQLDDGGADGTASAFTLQSNGRVTIGSYDETFPVLADAGSSVATPTTLVVAVKRSHDVFVLGLVPH